MLTKSMYILTEVAAHEDSIDSKPFIDCNLWDIDYEAGELGVPLNTGSS